MGPDVDESPDRPIGEARCEAAADPLRPFAVVQQYFSFRGNTGIAANEADWSKLTRSGPRQIEENLRVLVKRRAEIGVAVVKMPLCRLFAILNGARADGRWTNPATQQLNSIENSC
jgi:hypothetical protein